MSTTTVIAVICAALVYLGVALGYSFAARGRMNTARGRANAARRGLLGGMNESDWLEKHAKHVRYPSLYAAPTPSLRDYYAPEQVEGAEAVATVDYYRRTLLCPIWPTLLVSDVLTRYRRASEASAPYLLDQQRKQLAKAQEYSERLADAQREAQAAIDEARRSYDDEGGAS